MDRLEGLHRADAAIVGGGLTGLLLASALSQAGMQVAVVEARERNCDEPARAASLLRAAPLMRAAAAYGTSIVKQYAAGLQSQLHSLLAAPLPYVREIPVYAYAFHDELPILEHQYELLFALQLPVSIAQDAGGCPFPVELSLTAQGVLIDIQRWKDALYAAILRRGGRIYHSSRVIAVDSGRICTQQGCLDAPQIILTTGKPLGLRQSPLLALLESRLLARCDLSGEFPVHSCQQSLCNEGLGILPTPLGLSASWDAGRLGMPSQQTRLAAFEKALHRLLPDWTRGHNRYTQTVHSLDGLPLIGPLPDSQTLCIAGTDGCGVLGAMHAADAAARRILGHPLPEDTLFLPGRVIPKVVLRPLLRRHRRIYVRNSLRRNAPSCSNCACKMRYSTAVESWECPWCGSSYAMLGQVISAPAMHSAQVSVRQRPDI